MSNNNEIVAVLRQALEALEESGLRWPNIVEAITSLRQAIAEAEKQEPVAWRFKTGTFWNREPHWRYVLSLEGTEGLQGLEPLYTHPQPKREWVGLTDEEIEEVERWIEFKEEGSGRIPTGKLVRYIEAKLKEKNT